MASPACLSSRSAQLPVWSGREHEHLVHAAGGRLREHRAEVLHAERLVALEGREQVRHDAHQPVAARAVGLERRRGRLLVARAERALAVGIGLDRELARDELARAGRALDGDGDPAARQRVEAELAHEEQSRGVARLGRYRDGRRTRGRSTSGPKGAPAQSACRQASSSPAAAAMASSSSGPA